MINNYYKTRHKYARKVNTTRYSKNNIKYISG
jgi:hypothetical protein